MNVREYLTKIAKKDCPNQETFSDRQLLEWVIDEKTVWTGSDDVHRWYILREVVKKVGDLYIEFDEYVITGDNSMSDMSLEYNIDDFGFVEKKERVITEVYYE